MIICVATKIPKGVFIQIETRNGYHDGGEIVAWDAHYRRGQQAPCRAAGI